MNKRPRSVIKRTCAIRCCLSAVNDIMVSSCAFLAKSEIRKSSVLSRLLHADQLALHGRSGVLQHTANLLPFMENQEVDI